MSEPAKQVPVTPGELYQVSAWVRVPDSPPPDPASMRTALHAEADDLEANGGMVSAHWIASHLRFIADHGRRWPQPGEGPHISHEAAP